MPARAAVWASLGAADTLQIWERAEPLGPLDRALLLASFSVDDDLASAPIGRCHATLLVLRTQLFGPTLESTANCPACDARVEFAVDGLALLSLHEEGTESSGVIEQDEYVVSWRSPTPSDLAALAAEPGPPGASLLRRCVTVTAAVGTPLDATTVPAALIARIEEEMSAADPLAEVLVAVTCPECERRFEADVDLARFVWSEVDARARQVLHDIDVLARAYGWTEPEVLALSDARRASYLRLVVDGVS